MKQHANSLDRRFFDVSLQLSKKEDPHLLATLEDLLKQGATSSSFEDHELSDFNFPRLLSTYLSDEHLQNKVSDHQITSTMRLICRAGDAFKTNKGYVGNGGCQTAFFCFEFLVHQKDFYVQRQNLSEERIIPKAHFCYEILELISEHPSYIEFFWLSYFPALPRLLSSENPRLIEIHEKTIVFAINLDPFPYLTRSIKEYHNIPFRGFCLEKEGLLRLLRLLREHNLLKKLIDFLTELDDELITKVFYQFFASPENRSTLHELIRSNKWLLRLIFQRKHIVFKLIRMKERKTINLLIRLDSSSMRALRNEQGQNLLEYSLQMRGCTKRLQALLSKLSYD